MGFRALQEHELQQLGDDELIGYMRRARCAGRLDALKGALAVLVFGYLDVVAQRVRLKVPDTDVEDIAATAIESAIGSAFDGSSIGEFRSWLHTVVDRRIADYHRRRDGKPPLDLLPTEHTSDDGVWGEEPASSSEESALDARRALQRAYSDLNDEHKRVIDLYVFGTFSARQIAAAIEGMSEANVHQVASRFQRRFKELLDGDTED